MYNTYIYIYNITKTYMLCVDMYMYTYMCTHMGCNMFKQCIIMKSIHPIRTGRRLFLVQTVGGTL